MSKRAQPLIWLVDDDQSLLGFACELLSGQGLAVRTFSDPLAALDELTRETPDLVVLDVLMPQMSGFDFCAQLRARPDGRDLPVLMMTGMGDNDAINRAFEAGATGFVTKPINWAVELQRVRYMLRSAETARQLRLNEEATREAKETWEKTFSAIHDIVVVVDRKFHILQANRTTLELLELPPGGIEGLRYFELFEELPAPAPGCPVARALQTGVACSGEVSFKHPASVRLVSASPIRASKGEVTQAVVVARDLTEQKRLEGQLRHVQKMEAVGTLAGGVAHEFNNLLQAVIGSAELLKMVKDPDHEDHREINAILEAAKRGGALTRQMLTFSRKGAQWTEKVPLNLNDVVGVAQAMLSRILPKNVEVELQLAQELPKIKGDADQLQQAIINMVMNSVQAMPHGGRLTLSTARSNVSFRAGRLSTDSVYVLLSITDTGEGMDRHTQERMYEPFFTTRGVGGGTGLGLSVVFGIVKEHQGDIQCESTPGGGTTFHVRLPALVEPRLPVANPTDDPKQALPDRPLILVVDDEEPLRRTLQRVLNHLGFEVICEPDGPQALKVYEENEDRPNLVILDLGLPIMSGWECLEKLRAMDPTARVLVATGYGGEDLEARARSLGAAGILMKPYDIAGLAEKVRTILADGKPKEGQ